MLSSHSQSPETYRPPSQPKGEDLAELTRAELEQLAQADALRALKQVEEVEPAPRAGAIGSTAIRSEHPAAAEQLLGDAQCLEIIKSGTQSLTIIRNRYLREHVTSPVSKNNR